MRIDVLIRRLKEQERNPLECWLGCYEVDAIVALLRAAELMRLTAQQMAEDLYELSTSFEFALETWDAAVKGERGMVE